MGLDVRVKKRLKHFDLDISFSCPDGKIFVLIGPSGGGKTTIIRMIAGLERPDEGLIRYQDETWYDFSLKLCLTPQKRRLGYVFQEYTLFPHLTLYGNAAFAAVEKKQVNALLDFFGIAHLRDSKPHMVSGGERQRCAICQAVARQPRVLLLDEPFSALDVVTRRALREELKSLQGIRSIPIIYVTHDINEALYLADEMLTIVEGKVDMEWMERVAARKDAAGKLPKVAREPRLTLVY